ncbi:MAG: hypothetical protein WC451_00680 [Patescibacteria group bacterium]
MEYDIYHHGSYVIKLASGATPKLPEGIKVKDGKIVVENGRIFRRKSDDGQPRGLIGFATLREGQSESSFGLLAGQFSEVTDVNNNSLVK